MKTQHRIIFKDARKMGDLASESVELAVTSPPYPMIEMWDTVFASQNPAIADHLLAGRGLEAFDSMHELLDEVWRELYRILKPGCIACINIGDAVRTLNDRFQLYSNHARILNALQKTGFSALPEILWRKQINAPNKFMGSGMLPPGAYVTLEHEHILIVRKGNKRKFDSEPDRMRRRQSAFFWEERNVWFSDVWMDLKGAVQKLNGHEARRRSGAFPFELPYRLINMFSVCQDTVIDPFLGTGVAMLAAAAAGRNSIGFEIDSSFDSRISDQLIRGVDLAQQRLRGRIRSHLDFVENRIQNDQGEMKHLSRNYRFPVMTRQEVDLRFYPLTSIAPAGPGRFEATYSEILKEGYDGCETAPAMQDGRSDPGRVVQLSLL